MTWRLLALLRAAGVLSVLSVLVMGDGASVASLNVTTCVAIPCAAAHWEKLPVVLRSVAAQTLKPNSVVVTISFDTGPACAELQTQLARLYDGARLVCNHKRGWQTAANRNLAVQACAPNDIVGFIDADDALKPTRMERMVSLMQAHKADIGLHSYEMASAKNHSMNWVERMLTSARSAASSSLISEVNITKPADFVRLAQQGAAVALLKRFPKAHYGHSVVRSSLFKAVKQRQEEHMQEDRTFAHETILKGYHAVHTSEELSVYFKDSSANVWQKIPHTHRPTVRAPRPRTNTATSTAHRPSAITVTPTIHRRPRTTTTAPNTVQQLYSKLMKYLYGGAEQYVQHGAAPRKLRLL